MNLKEIDQKFQTVGVLTDEELKLLYKAYNKLLKDCTFLGEGFAFFKKEIRLTEERLRLFTDARKTDRFKNR